MSDKPVNLKSIAEFPGYGTNRDPHETPEIAIDVNNMVFHEPGKLSCRKGHAQFTFTNNSADAPDGKIISALPYKRAGHSYVVHQDSNGNVRVGRL